MFTRWQATVLYDTRSGPDEVVHELEELDDLHALVEHGPHWGSIKSIVITLHPAYTGERGTVEELSAK